MEDDADDWESDADPDADTVAVPELDDDAPDVECSITSGFIRS